MLDRRSTPQRLLDTDHTPAATAIHGLFATIKNEVETPDGGWNGGDTVNVLTEWFTALGFDVDAAPTNTDTADED